MTWPYITEGDRREIFNMAQDWANASKIGDTDTALAWRETLNSKLKQLARN